MINLNKIDIFQVKNPNKEFNYLKQLKKSYIIILAWNFSDSIIEKCRKINKKFKFICHSKSRILNNFRSIFEQIIC